MAEPIASFKTRRLSFGGVERSVLVATSEGRPVIVLHEVFGMTKSVADFAEMIRRAGFRVYLPVLFGSTKLKSGAMGRAKGLASFVCAAHQFRVLARDQSGPWADWLRQLADLACDDTGSDGVGVIGLCLTGNFALAMAMNPKVKAPVMGEPSLPIWRDGLHLSPQELAALKARTDLEVRAYRYARDKICRASLLDRLQTELGSAFVPVALPTEDSRLHSVFTEHLRNEDGRLRHDKVNEVIDFLRRKLA